MDDVLAFINEFKAGDTDSVLEKRFLHDYDYYFALILADRFNGSILYDCILGHFIALLNVNGENHFYDISGCVDSVYTEDAMIHWADNKFLWKTTYS